MQRLFSLNRIIVLFLSIGLLVLAFEVFLQHYNKLFERRPMWIPIIFGSVGGLIGLFIFIIFNRFSYYLFLLLMILSMIVGTLGLYFHNNWRFPLILSSLRSAELVSIEFLTTKPPFLAPSAFIAMGGLGILIAFYLSWNKN
jgi:hypothetical protein